MSICVCVENVSKKGYKPYRFKRAVLGSMTSVKRIHALSRSLPMVLPPMSPIVMPGTNLPSAVRIRIRKALAPLGFPLTNNVATTHAIVAVQPCTRTHVHGLGRRVVWPLRPQRSHGMFCGRVCRCEDIASSSARAPWHRRRILAPTPTLGLTDQLVHLLKRAGLGLIRDAQGRRPEVNARSTRMRKDHSWFLQL